MHPTVDAALALAKEFFGFIRDFNDPVKREGNYRLYVEKRAKSALDEADAYMEYAEKFADKVQVLAGLPKESIKPEDIKQVTEFRRWMIHHKKRFRAFK